MTWFMAWAALSLGGHGVQVSGDVGPSCADDSCETSCDRNGKACAKECSQVKSSRKADCVDFCKRKQDTCAASCGAAESLE